MKAIDLRACLIAALSAALLAGCASSAATDATMQPGPAPAQTSVPF